MSGLDKQTFRAMVEQIVEGFEDAGFKAELGQAKAAGDVGRIAGLAMGVQSAVFTRHGLDPLGGTMAFKEAGKAFGLDPEIAPLLVRMKAALS